MKRTTATTVSHLQQALGENHVADGKVVAVSQGKVLQRSRQVSLDGLIEKKPERQPREPLRPHDAVNRLVEISPQVQGCQTVRELDAVEGLVEPTAERESLGTNDRQQQSEHQTWIILQVKRRGRARETEGSVASYSIYCAEEERMQHRSGIHTQQREHKTREVQVHGQDQYHRRKSYEQVRKPDHDQNILSRSVRIVANMERRARSFTIPRMMMRVSRSLPGLACVCCNTG